MQRRWAVIALVAAMAVSACNAGDRDGPLRVTAASSLRAALPSISVPGLDVVHSFAGSQTVTAHVLGGAPVDVVVTADEESMQRLVDAEAIEGDPVPIAGNELVVIVPAGNPARITGLADLSGDGLVVAVGAPTVPVGRYTADALAAAGVTLRGAAQEASVAGVVTKVRLGEADAGVAYASDVAAADGELEAVPLGVPSPSVVLLAGVVRNGREDVASLYLAALVTPAGRRALEQAGFTTPDPPPPAPTRA